MKKITQKSVFQIKVFEKMLKLSKFYSVLKKNKSWTIQMRSPIYNKQTLRFVSKYYDYVRIPVRTKIK